MATSESGSGRFRTPGRGPARDLAGRRRRVTFVAVWAYGSGGVPRAISAVANELARRGHEVELVSVYRTSPAPYVDLDPRVRVRGLVDLVDPAGGENLPRPRRNPASPPEQRRLDRQPSTLAAGGYESFSGLTDLLLQELFEDLPPGIVVTTRPELAVAATRSAPEDVVVVEAEHLTFDYRPDGVRDALVSVGDRLDALVLLTEADGDAWRRVLTDPRVHVGVIPNAPTFTLGEPAPLTAPLVIAAGRLTAQKSFDRLIDAFAPIAADHPEWQLHIYGRGRREGELHDQIERLRLPSQVHLKGFTDRFEERLAEASVYGMSSRYEGFPMVLLEAMTKGVPPVSLDCPQGPRQLIADGVNGLLVGRFDLAGFSAALRRLVEDADLRRRLGRGALATAADYTLERVVGAWEELFDELVERRTTAGR